MKYISSSQAADLWGISTRRVSLLASQGRIEGAELTGNTWLIPENAKKPADIRKKGVKADSEVRDRVAYYYPISYVHSEAQVRRFYPEEKELYRASLLMEAGEFAECKECCVPLLDSNDRSVRLGARYQLIFACLYLYDYEAAEKYSVQLLSEYYSIDKQSISEQILLQSYEMEIGQTSSFLASPDYGDVLSLSPDLLPLAASMKLLKETIQFTRGGPQPDVCSYGIICRQAEAQGFYFSPALMNMVLSVLNGLLNNPDNEVRYMKRAVELAVEHNIVTSVSNMLPCSPVILESVLSSFPSDYARRVYSVSERILRAREGFSAYKNRQRKRSVYFDLTVDDYRLLLYCSRNYSNERLAELFDMSRAGINKRLSNLYHKLGVETKKEMLQSYLDFVYDWNR